MILYMNSVTGWLYYSSLDLGKKRQEPRFIVTTCEPHRFRIGKVNPSPLSTPHPRPLGTNAGTKDLSRYWFSIGMRLPIIYYVMCAEHNTESLESSKVSIDLKS